MSGVSRKSTDTMTRRVGADSGNLKGSSFIGAVTPILRTHPL